MHQWHNSKDQSEGQYDLTEHKQTPSAVVATDGSDDGSWNDSNGASDETPQPWLDPNLEKTLHHHLAQRKNRTILGGKILS